MAAYNSPTSYSSTYKEVPTQIQTRNHENLWGDRARKWSTRVSRIRRISRMTSAMMNTVMFAFMSFVISVFIATRHDEALGRPIWPRSPETWPTYMLLAASLLTMITSILLLLYYCLFPKHAAESWKVIVLSYTIHILLWLVVTFLYRLEKGISDLWGWSCTDIAKDLQANGDIAVDFSKLCRIQTASWVLSIVETSLKVVFSIALYFAYRKTKAARAKQYLAEGGGEGVLGVLDALM